MSFNFSNRYNLLLGYPNTQMMQDYLGLLKLHVEKGSGWKGRVQLIASDSKGDEEFKKCTEVAAPKLAPPLPEQSLPPSPLFPSSYEHLNRVGSYIQSEHQVYEGNFFTLNCFYQELKGVFMQNACHYDIYLSGHRLSRMIEGLPPLNPQSPHIFYCFVPLFGLTDGWEDHLKDVFQTYANAFYNTLQQRLPISKKMLRYIPQQGGLCFYEIMGVQVKLIALCSQLQQDQSLLVSDYQKLMPALEGDKKAVNLSDIYVGQSQSQWAMRPVCFSEDERDYTQAIEKALLFDTVHSPYTFKELHLQFVNGGKLLSLEDYYKHLHSFITYSGFERELSQLNSPTPENFLALINLVQSLISYKKGITELLSQALGKIFSMDLYQNLYPSVSKQINNIDLHLLSYLSCLSLSQSHEDACFLDSKQLWGPLLSEETYTSLIALLCHPNIFKSCLTHLSKPEFFPSLKLKPLSHSLEALAHQGLFQFSRFNSFQKEKLLQALPSFLKEIYQHLPSSCFDNISDFCCAQGNEEALKALIELSPPTTNYRQQVIEKLFHQLNNRASFIDFEKQWNFLMGYQNSENLPLFINALYQLSQRSISSDYVPNFFKLYNTLPADETLKNHPQMQSLREYLDGLGFSLISPKELEDQLRKTLDQKEKRKEAISLLSSYSKRGCSLPEDLILPSLRLVNNWQESEYPMDSKSLVELFSLSILSIKQNKLSPKTSKEIEVFVRKYRDSFPNLLQDYVYFELGRKLELLVPKVSIEEERQVLIKIEQALANGDIQHAEALAPYLEYLLLSAKHKEQLLSISLLPQLQSCLEALRQSKSPHLIQVFLKGILKEVFSKSHLKVLIKNLHQLAGEKELQDYQKDFEAAAVVLLDEVDKDNFALRYLTRLSLNNKNPAIQGQKKKWVKIMLAQLQKQGISNEHVSDILQGILKNISHLGITHLETLIKAVEDLNIDNLSFFQKILEEGGGSKQQRSELCLKSFHLIAQGWKKKLSQKVEVSSADDQEISYIKQLCFDSGKPGEVYEKVMPYVDELLLTDSKSYGAVNSFWLEEKNLQHLSPEALKHQLAFFQTKVNREAFKAFYEAMLRLVNENNLEVYLLFFPLEAHPTLLFKLLLKLDAIQESTTLQPSEGLDIFYNCLLETSLLGENIPPLPEKILLFLQKYYPTTPQKLEAFIAKNTIEKDLKEIGNYLKLCRQFPEPLQYPERLLKYMSQCRGVSFGTSDWAAPLTEMITCLASLAKNPQKNQYKGLCQDIFFKALKYDLQSYKEPLHAHLMKVLKDIYKEDREFFLRFSLIPFSHPAYFCNTFSLFESIEKKVFGNSTLSQKIFEASLQEAFQDIQNPSEKEAKTLRLHLYLHQGFASLLSNSFKIYQARFIIQFVKNIDKLVLLENVAICPQTEKGHLPGAECYPYLYKCLFSLGSLLTPEDKDKLWNISTFKYSNGRGGLGFYIGKDVFDPLVQAQVNKAFLKWLIPEFHRKTTHCLAHGQISLASLFIYYIEDQRTPSLPHEELKELFIGFFKELIKTENPEAARACFHILDFAINTHSPAFKMLVKPYTLSLFQKGLIYRCNGKVDYEHFKGYCDLLEKALSVPYSTSEKEASPFIDLNELASSKNADFFHFFLDYLKELRLQFEIEQSKENISQSFCLFANEKLFSSHGLKAYLVEMINLQIENREMNLQHFIDLCFHLSLIPQEHYSSDHITFFHALRDLFYQSSYTQVFLPIADGKKLPIAEKSSSNGKKKRGKNQVPVVNVVKLSQEESRLYIKQQICLEYHYNQMLVYSGDEKAVECLLSLDSHQFFSQTNIQLNSFIQYLKEHKFINKISQEHATLLVSYKPRAFAFALPVLNMLLKQLIEKEGGVKTEGKERDIIGDLEKIILFMESYELFSKENTQVSKRSSQINYECYIKPTCYALFHSLGRLSSATADEAHIVLEPSFLFFMKLFNHCYSHNPQIVFEPFMLYMAGRAKKLQIPITAAGRAQESNPYKIQRLNGLIAATLFRSVQRRNLIGEGEYTMDFSKLQPPMLRLFLTHSINALTNVHSSIKSLQILPKQGSFAFAEPLSWGNFNEMTIHWLYFIYGVIIPSQEFKTPQIERLIQDYFNGPLIEFLNQLINFSADGKEYSKTYKIQAFTCFLSLLKIPLASLCSEYISQAPLFVKELIAYANKKLNDPNTTKDLKDCADCLTDLILDTQVTYQYLEQNLLRNHVADK